MFHSLYLKWPYRDLNKHRVVTHPHQQKHTIYFKSQVNCPTCFSDKSSCSGRRQYRAVQHAIYIYSVKINSGRYKYKYRGADKSLARPGRKQATATEDFDFHIAYLQS